jgi:hypothetical protein
MVQWPLDKLSVLNSALAITGDYQCAVLEDGSDEYTVASPAYERALAFALEDHGWVAQTKVVNNLTKLPTSPADDQFDSSYAIPSDCLHIIWVRQNDRPALYTILSGQIVTRSMGIPGPVSIKYLSTDNSDIENGTPTFVLALQEFVVAGIYRGLHEDLPAAAQAEQAAMAVLTRAKMKSDQQKPRQAFFNSRLAMSRRVRRPWPPQTNWSGTGQPGN